MGIIDELLARVIRGAHGLPASDLSTTYSPTAVKATPDVTDTDKIRYLNLNHIAERASIRSDVIKVFDPLKKTTIPSWRCYDPGFA